MNTLLLYPYAWTHLDNTSDIARLSVPMGEQSPKKSSGNLIEFVMYICMFSVETLPHAERYLCDILMVTIRT